MSEKELTKEQQYCKSQIEDLENKESQLSFQLDQVRASKTVFINLLAEHTKDVAEEVVDKSDKEKKK
jgi:hypothetical protein